MSDLPDLREQIAALFRSAPGETRLGDEPPGLIADAVLGVLPEGWDRFVRTIQVLRDQVAAAEASRRDWAAEAEALDAVHSMVVERLTEEIRWQKHAYRGDARDRTDVLAKGRTIGMEDALRTVENTFAEAEKSRSSVHPEGGGS
jgi:hypothetical protein